MRELKVQSVSAGEELAGYVNGDENLFIPVASVYPVSYAEDPMACFAVIEALAQQEGDILVLRDDADDAEEGQYLFTLDPAPKG
jgi:hypothetical protein